MIRYGLLAVVFGHLVDKKHNRSYNDIKYSVGKVQVTTMLKNLFNFKVSKQMKVAKGILLVGMLAAIVITAFGLVEIMDVKLMKELQGVARPTMGGVLAFLLQNYLGWALLILAIAVGVYVYIRYLENKTAANA